MSECAERWRKVRKEQRDDLNTVSSNSDGARPKRRDVPLMFAKYTDASIIRTAHTNGRGRERGREREEKSLCGGERDKEES